ncbi:MAG: ATP-binding cassette domain-containing protein [Alphaproteobacteria bacterium]|nr:ATP-binding cassette domain-containing protein [Alphaproteobacteria bacterium]
MLEARHLDFCYAPGKPILKDISLQVDTNGITVLIGPSGCGKTTLLRCMALLESPQSGEIAVDDEVFRYPWPKDAPFTPPWPKLTTVFQQLFLWPHLTLRENILLPVRRQKSGSMNGELDALIEAFDMKEFIDNYPNEASLGQRQRVALARALMLEPRYLLLDEITSALDVEQIAKILSYLKTLRGKHIGIFIITHLLGFARHAADQVVFMASGEIVESGGADILKNPQTERLGQFLSVIAAAS